MELDTSSVRLQADGRPAKAGRYIWVAAIVLAAAGFASAQDTSTDKGEQIQNAACLNCHDLGRVRIHTVSREEWEETLLTMLNEGAMLSDQDFPVLLNYLARNFRQ